MTSDGEKTIDMNIHDVYEKTRSRARIISGHITYPPVDLGQTMCTQYRDARYRQIPDDNTPSLAISPRQCITLFSGVKNI